MQRVERVEEGQLWLDKKSKGERVVYIQSISPNRGGYANCLSYNLAKCTRRYVQIRLKAFSAQFRPLAT